MKKNIYLIAATLMLLGYPCTTSSNNNDQPDQEASKTDTVTNPEANQQDSSIGPCSLLTLSDAEKILGEPAHLTESASIIKGDTSKFSCAYTANSEDQNTGKIGAVYFLFEQYKEVSSAKKKYSFIKRANENHEGVKELHDMGDEAYFHSDGQNFYFIMVRKGERIYNMKVNKITSTTSLEEFNSVARKITDTL